MTEFNEIADILYDVKENVGDGNYLRLCNLVASLKKRHDGVQGIRHLNSLVPVATILPDSSPIILSSGSSSYRSIPQSSQITRNIQVVCECGCIVRKYYLHAHKNTIKHYRRMNSQANNTS